MGGGGSRVSGTYNIFIHNADFAWVKITEGGGEGERIEWIQKGREAQFQYKEKGYSRLLVQVISDPKSENPQVLKQVTLYSYRDHSWIVKTDGVKKQKYGDELTVVDPNGSTAGWSFENRRKKRNICTNQEEEHGEVIHVEAGILNEFFKQDVYPVSGKIMKLLIQEEASRDGGIRTSFGSRIGEIGTDQVQAPVVAGASVYALA